MGFPWFTCLCCFGSLSKWRMSLSAGSCKGLWADVCLFLFVHLYDPTGSGVHYAPLLFWILNLFLLKLIPSGWFICNQCDWNSMKTISDMWLSPVNSPKETFVKTALAASGFHEFKSATGWRQSCGAEEVLGWLARGWDVTDDYAWYNIRDAVWPVAGVLLAAGFLYFLFVFRPVAMWSGSTNWRWSL